MINVLWFIVIVVMIGGYAVLDGFDLGVGALHLVVARTPDERETAINAIGPVWNGNEVWLLAGGGALVVAFPHVYAESFSGFYLALMLVLWLLVFRGLGIEFRHQVNDHLWHQGWDVAFSIASLLLAVLFGVAVANVLRGLPLSPDGEFQGTFTLLLNPFSILGGVLSLVALSLHGAAYLAMKTDGPLQHRARRLVVPLWIALIVLIMAMVAASFAVRPDFIRNFTRWPVLVLVPLLAVAGLVGVRIFAAGHEDTRAFLSSAAVILGVLGSAAAGLFPRLLPTLYGSAYEGLDIYNAASAPHSLRIALAIYLIGLVLVSIYLVNAYRVWGGKVTVEHQYKI